MKKSANKGAMLGAALLAGIAAGGEASAQTTDKNLSPEDKALIEGILNRNPELRKRHERVKQLEEIERRRKEGEVDIIVKDKEGNPVGTIWIKPDSNTPKNQEKK